MLSCFEFVSGSEASSLLQCCSIYINTDFKKKNANVATNCNLELQRGRGQLMREASEYSSQIDHQGFKKGHVMNLSLHSFQQNSWACWRKSCGAYPVRFSATVVRRSAGRSSKRQVRTWLKVGSLQQLYFWSCRSGAASSQGIQAALLGKVISRSSDPVMDISLTFVGLENDQSWQSRE